MKIISGGQRGVDIAALQEARSQGIQTGGWMPKGFTTLDGPRPEYARIFGMLESHDGGYPVRTEMNVKTADVTIRFGSNFGSYGERCTAKYIGIHKKPHIDIHINPIDWEYFPGKPNYVVDWLMVYKPEIINIAGNANVSLESSVRSFLGRVLRSLKMYPEYR